MKTFLENTQPQQRNHWTHDVAAHLAALTTLLGNKNIHSLGANRKLQQTTVKICFPCPWDLRHTEGPENAQPYQLLTAISGHKDLTSRRAIIVEVRLPLWNGRHFPNPFPISESSWFQAVLTRYWRDCQIISVVSGCQCDQTETTENGLLWVWALVEAT